MKSGASQLMTLTSREKSPRATLLAAPILSGAPRGRQGHCETSACPLSGLELDVLVRGGIGVAADEAEPALLHARPHAVQEGELPDGREHDLVVDELLDAMQGRLAALSVQLGRLLLEEPVDVRIAAVGVRAPGDHERLETGGGIAECSARALDDVLQLLLCVLLEECRALDGAKPGPDPHGLEVVDPALGEIAVGDVAIVVPGVEAVGIAGVREELLGAGWIVAGGGRLPEELEGARDDAAVDPGKADRKSVV